MKVPVRLVQRAEAAPAEAYLLLADSAQPLVDALARGVSAHVYRVHGGFLLIPTANPAHAPYGAIRLRRLSANLYLPADAELRPAFLPDELADLTAKRGLVALPGNFLAFDASSPLAPAEWLAVPPVRRRDWQPIPPAPFQPDRLSRIEFRDDRPAAVIEILNQGQPDDAQPLPGQGEAGGSGPMPEDARPPTAGGMTRFGAGAKLAAGQALAWIGRQLSMPGLANLGGKLARKAVEQVPRLTEKVLGAQEAALREILRQLQSGDAEQALRRAPIAVGDPDAPSRVSDTAQLSTVDPRYSLRSLLGSGGGGVGAAWLGGGDVWHQLADEYRRLAREALARGDFRRAAYLYGVLLRDLRSAANALASGGLHRDAAILYRDKLNDPLAAAQSFERAGDVEESLRLYEKMERYEEAAEMLRRMGDDERAEQLYLRAAGVHAGKNRWLAAGDLVRTKLGRHDLSEEYYRSGWTFAGPEVVPCGQRMLAQYLAQEEWSKAEALFSEAEERFEPGRTLEANAFFNNALRVRDFLPVEQHDDWQDRTRRLFAEHARLAMKPANTAGDMFADPRNWPPELQRDAMHAAKTRMKLPAEESPPERTKKLLDGTVVAVAVARDSRDIVVASTTAVVVWRVKENRVQQLPGGWIRNEVIRLSVDARAENVFVLSHNGPKITLQSFVGLLAGDFKEGGKVEHEIEGTEPADWYVSPDSEELGGEPTTTLVRSVHRDVYRGHIPKLCHSTSGLVRSPVYLISTRDGSDGWNWDKGSLFYIDGFTERTWQPHWHPDTPRGNPILVSPMDTIIKPGTLEIAAVDQKGILCWSRFEANLGEDDPRSHQLFSHHMDRFAAACLLRANVLAAVTFKNEVLWYRVHQGKLEQYAKATPLAVPSQAVFLVARPQARELAAMLEDGSAMLVQMP